MRLDSSAGGYSVERDSLVLCANGGPLIMVGVRNDEDFCSPCRCPGNDADCRSPRRTGIGSWGGVVGEGGGVGSPPPVCSPPPTSGPRPPVPIAVLVLECLHEIFRRKVGGVVSSSGGFPSGGFSSSGRTPVEETSPRLLHLRFVRIADSSISL